MRNINLHMVTHAAPAARSSGKCDEQAHGFFNRDLPGEGELPLWQVTEAVLANNPALTVELEVPSMELKGLSSEAAAARCRMAMDKWTGVGTAR